jgi:hypothetical protein
MRTVSTLSIAIISLAAGAVMSINAASAGDVIGWMEVKPADQQIGISGRAYALSDTKIEYELRIERQGRAGKTATNQRGKADLAPGKTAELSTTSVNISSGDEMAILLTIRSGGQIVSTSAVHVGPH